MYDNAIKTKKDADLIFREAMKALGFSKLKRNIMYFAVVIFGKGTYS